MYRSGNDYAKSQGSKMSVSIPEFYGYGQQIAPDPQDYDYNECAICDVVVRHRGENLYSVYRSGVSITLACELILRYNRLYEYESDAKLSLGGYDD